MTEGDGRHSESGPSCLTGAAAANPGTPEPQDPSAKRWRLTLTVGAWLLIAQSGLSVLTGLVGIALAPIADPGAMLGQLGPVIDRSSIALFGTLMRQGAFLNRIQTVGSLILLVGSIGLLLRKKWGWYTVVVAHVAAGAAIFIWVMPMFETLYLALDPTNAGAMALFLSILSALAPAVVIAFLLSKPIISQFEPMPAADGATKQS
jgi:hypothetical protein